jgi:hypothetical protein
MFVPVLERKLAMTDRTETLIVYVDDAEHARHQIAPLVQQGEPIRWILVACPPHMSRRVGKWLSQTARQNWRESWSAKLTNSLSEWLRQAGGQVVARVAKEPFPAFTQQLQKTYGVARVVDARRPKFGVGLPPITEQQPQDGRSWELPAAVGALGAVMIIAAE